MSDDAQPMAAERPTPQPAPGPKTNPEPDPSTVPPAGFCLGCGYDLLGLPSTGRCPECAFSINTSRVAEVRDLAGLPTLKRFRFALLALALSFILLPAIVWAMHNNWLAEQAFKNSFKRGLISADQYNQFTRASIRYYTSLGVAGITIVFMFFMTTCLIRVPKRLAPLQRSMLTPPRILSVRTAVIAFGTTLLCAAIAAENTLELFHAGTLKFGIIDPGILIGILWILFGLAAWAVVSRLVAGRLRWAFRIAWWMCIAFIAAFIVVAVLERGVRHLRWQWPDTRLGRSVPIQSLALLSWAMLAMGAGLLWRWLALGYHRRATAALASAFAALAPVGIVMFGLALGTREWRHEDTALLPYAIPALAAIAASGLILGIDACLAIRRIRRRGKLAPKHQPPAEQPPCASSSQTSSNPQASTH
ncbi:MAG: hypothetical protein ACTS3F_00740 [Phycisphaerales bacterium]